MHLNLPRLILIIIHVKRDIYKPLQENKEEKYLSTIYTGIYTGLKKHRIYII